MDLEGQDALMRESALLKKQVYQPYYAFLTIIRVIHVIKVVGRVSVIKLFMVTGSLGYNEL